MRTSLLLLAASLVLLAGCRPPSDSYVYELGSEEHQRLLQVADYEKHRGHYEKQMADYDKQTKRVDAQLDKSDEQDLRFDKILEQWEEQTRRYDAILDAMEKQHGLSK
jgi:hypothetical protein